VNLDAIEKEVRLRIKNLYFSKFPENGVQIDIPDFDQNSGRLRRLQRRICEHRVFLRRRGEHKAIIAKQIKLLREIRTAIDAGARLIAIDVERNIQQVTQEIGYTTFQNGVMKSFNLRIQGAPRRRTNFSFGDSEVLTWDEIKERLRIEVDKSAYMIGHSFATDLTHMKDNGLRLPFRPLADTFWLSIIIPHFENGRHGANLSDMATYFGIHAPNPHSGGNDARYNMELLLAMVEAYGTYD
jgi:hypothetical protein